MVVVVSSLHDVARAQTDHLRTQLDPAELRILQPDESLLDQPNRLSQWAAGELEVPESLPQVVVITSPEAVGGSETLSGAAIANSLASVVQQALARASVGALVLVGGDGARAVLDATRAQALRITGAIQEGIPVGVVEGGTAAGKIVVTKAGGFGPVTALLDTVTELTRTLTTTLAHSTEASS
ncbi:nucleotide-binding domain containing protein [Arthrobacter sp. Leaf234]|uniref:nucleotide-binding domain containing protein n=1 Tax=Arthrobacter sp. Leaf234 TaxID=1736303 RepID=UPI0009E68BC8|nr:nucleotide-binding domain containing protein [Arthrobacter sp. Leaf234]